MRETRDEFRERAERQKLRIIWAEDSKGQRDMIMAASEGTPYDIHMKADSALYSFGLRNGEGWDAVVLDMSLGEKLASLAAGSENKEFDMAEPFKRYPALLQALDSSNERRLVNDTFYLAQIIKQCPTLVVQSVPDGLVLLKRTEHFYGPEREVPILICTATFEAQASSYIQSGLGEDYINKGSIVSMIESGRFTDRIYEAKRHLERNKNSNDKKKQQVTPSLTSLLNK